MEPFKKQVRAKKKILDINRWAYRKDPKFSDS